TLACFGAWVPQIHPDGGGNPGKRQVDTLAGVVILGSMTLATTTATLTVAEADQLAHCEAVIAKGLQTFIEVGQALLTIRDNRLYRTSYGTFEEYCRKTWGMSKTHANRVIDSAEVAEVLTPIGVTPATESQARELAPLKDDPDTMRAVWEAANERTDGKPTAKVIRECREELTAEPEILDAEVVEDLPPVDERQQWEARLNEEVFLIDKAIGRIHALTGWGHDPSKAARVVEDLEYLSAIINSNLETIRNYAQS